MPPTACCGRQWAKAGGGDPTMRSALRCKPGHGGRSIYRPVGRSVGWPVAGFQGSGMVCCSASGSGGSGSRQQQQQQQLRPGTRPRCHSSGRSACGACGNSFAGEQDREKTTSSGVSEIELGSSWCAQQAAGKPVMMRVESTSRPGGVTMVSGYNCFDRDRPRRAVPVRLSHALHSTW